MAEVQQGRLDLPSGIMLEEKKRSPAKKRANSLDGKTWTRYSISIWSDIRKTPEEIALGHPAIFPLELSRRLLKCFTCQDDQVVLDPFMGVGTTLLAAEELGKAGIGFEIYSKFAAKAQERLAQTRYDPERVEGLPGTPKSRVYCADARKLLEHLPGNCVDKVITSSALMRLK